MEGPSLSEITSIRPEATLNPGVIYEGGAEMVRQINQSAQFNAEMKQRKYSESLGLLKDIYQDIGAVQAMPIMEEDRPVIAKKLADVFDEIGKDPRAALAGNKYGEIEKKLGEVRSLATQSKQDNIAYDYNRKYLQSDPDLQTPENNTKLDNFSKTPLGARKFPLLEMPPAFDVTKAAGNVMKLAGRGYSETAPDENNQNFITKSGTEFDRNIFLKNWSAGFDANPKIKKWADSLFDKIKDDPTQLGAYADPQTGAMPKNSRDLYNNAGKWEFNGGQSENIRSEKPDKRVPNPYELATFKGKIQAALIGLREQKAEALATTKESLKNAPVPQNAAFLVKTYAAYIQPTSGNPEVLNLPEGQGKVTEQPINNLTNNILKQIVENQKTTIKSGSALGASEAVSSGKDPDLTTRTDKGGIRITYFKKYTEDDRLKMPAGAKVGDDVIDPQTGLKVVESTQVLQPRTVLTTIAPSLISKPIIGQTVETAANYLNGKSTADIDKTITPENIEDETLQSKKEVSSTAKGKSYKLGTKTFTEAQVEKAAKASGYSVEEYIKQVGLK